MPSLEECFLTFQFKVNFDASSGIPNDMVDRILKFVNRKIKLKNENSDVTQFLSFPSFCDVYKICGDVNKEKNLGFAESVVKELGDFHFPPNVRFFGVPRECFNDQYCRLMAWRC